MELGVVVVVVGANVVSLANKSAFVSLKNVAFAKVGIGVALLLVDGSNVELAKEGANEGA